MTGLWFLTLLPLSLATLHPNTTPAVTKCTADLPGANYMVDGEIVATWIAGSGPGMGVAAGDVLFTQLLCLKEAEGPDAGKTRLTIFVVTKSGGHRFLERTLARLVDAQNSFHARYGSYASLLGMLAFENHPSVDLSIERTADGWSATAGLYQDRGAPITCQVTVLGSGDTLREDSTVPVCQSRAVSISATELSAGSRAACTGA